MDPFQSSSKLVDSNSEPRIQDLSMKTIPVTLLPKEPLQNLNLNSDSNSLSWIHDSNNCLEETDPLDLNSEVEPVDIKQEINDSENIDFQSYVDAAKEDKIPWNQFVDLVSNLASSSMSKQKQLNSILLEELKGYKNRENELQNEIEILKVTLESSRLDVKKLKQEIDVFRQTKFQNGNSSKTTSFPSVQFPQNPLPKSMLNNSTDKNSANYESAVQDIQMLLPKNPLLTGK